MFFLRKEEMKNGMSILFLSALLCGLCVGVTSCSDDDDDKEKTGPSAEEKQEQAEEAALKFWDVVGQLTSMDNYTADYRDKTFEPTIGEPQNGDPQVRLVATNDMASAAERFAALAGLEVGASFSADVQDYTWNDPDVGTLVYHRTDNGQSWAEVDVDIKQLKLQKIIYCSAGQAGDNASFSGSAYYRFGDVVSRINEDGKTEYWVCVRPAFSKEGKGDSHWVTLSPQPQKNVAHITKFGRDFYVPTALGKNEEQMQNFAELMWAIYHPDSWYKNVKDNSAPGIFSSGLRMFHDFSHSEDMVRYHNPYFWKRVRMAWEYYGLFKTVFGFDEGPIPNIFNHPLYTTNRLHLLYSGYSWWSSVSNNLSLYEITYENGNDAKELNMHKVTKREVKKDMTDLNLNVNSDYTAEHPCLVNNGFFGDDDPRYIIRHATGQELTSKGSKWDCKQPISGVNNVYTYNRFFYPIGSDYSAKGEHFRDLNITEPEVTNNPEAKSHWNRDAYNGDSFFLPGDVVIGDDGSRWFCLINSGGEIGAQASLNGPYSYFISFDKIIDSKTGEIARDIVQEQTLPKLMVPWLHFFSNYKQNNVSEPYASIARHIQEQTGVDMLKTAIMCDSVVTVVGTGNKDSRPGICTTVAFPTNDKSGWQLMRAVHDGAYGSTENRQWHYFFYTKYEKTEVPILLSDIVSQEKVNLYGPDRWAVLPLHSSAQRRQWRTQPDNRATDINNYMWNDGEPATDATSMWNEPVLVFRVTQLYDRGSDFSTITFWNNSIKNIILSPMHKDFNQATTARSWWPVNSVGAIIGKTMTKDGEAYQWFDWHNDFFR